VSDTLVSPIHAVYINSKAAHAEFIRKEWDRLSPYFTEKVYDYVEAHGLTGDRTMIPLDVVPSVWIEGCFWATMQWQAEREKEGRTMFEAGMKVRLRGMGGLIKYGIVVADEQGYEIEEQPFRKPDEAFVEAQDVRVDCVRVNWFYQDGTLATPHGAWANPLFLEEIQ
jgi:hypothetical protein